MYEAGQGVPQDDAEAVAWYRQAAEQGHTEAQFNLGFMYATGRGVSRDLVEAAAWWFKAATQGLADLVARSTPSGVTPPLTA